MEEMTEINELYLRLIRPLSPADRRRLLAIMVRDLDEGTADLPQEGNLLELEGMGAEMWHGIDAQAYVNILRDEWEHCS